MNPRDFLRSHPAIIKSLEAFEHEGLDGAEDVLLAAVGAHLGFFSKFLPLQTIADKLKAMAEGKIDGALDSLMVPPDAPPASPVATATPAPAAPASPTPGGADPKMLAFQARRAAQLAKVQNPNLGGKPPDDDLQPDDRAANP